MFKLIVNSLRKRAKVVLILLPILLVSDQLWAKSSKLLILGDSLSAGYGLTQAQSWVSLLQDAWQKSNITVVNAAISGETTDGALARLPRLLSQHSPSHIYVELGGNDGLQGHSITKMRNNLMEIVKLSQESGATVILQEMQIMGVDTQNFLLRLILMLPKNETSHYCRFFSLISPWIPS